MIVAAEKADLTLPVGDHTVALTVLDSGGNDNTEVTTINVLPFGYPDIESIAPTNGNLLGGTEVTITGSGFTTATEMIVNFGLYELTGSEIVILDSNTIKVTSPGEAFPIPVQVSVKSIPLDATSNSKQFTYETPIPLKWNSRLFTTFESVTVANFGPDGKLYAGNLGGKLAKFTLNDDFTVASQVISTVAEGRAILGLNFDPMTAGMTNPPVYFTSSQLFHGESNSSSGTAINGKLHRATGANLDTVENIITGLPVCDLDHGK